jgi:catechol 2,3-dioxygenase-like lactoylglutathione lyase family enzyme
MRARVTLITLAVDDLQRAVGFYRDGLGWQTQGIVGTEFEYGAVAVFNLERPTSCSRTTSTRRTTSMPSCDRRARPALTS